MPAELWMRDLPPAGSTRRRDRSRRLGKPKGSPMDNRRPPAGRRALVELVKDVPPMPLVAHRVLEMARDPQQACVADLVKVISTDQGLTAKILRTCNAPAYGLRSQVRSLSQAVVLLGLRSVRNLVVLHSLPVHGRGRPSFEETAMWSHSMAVALGARLLADRSRTADPEEAFLGGLLHDVGRLVLALAYEERYLSVFRAIYNREGPSIELERRHLGFDHAQVGALVTRRWDFPLELAQAVGEHHAPADTLSGLTLVVCAANELIHRMGIGGRPPEEGEEAPEPGLEALGVSHAELEDARERIQATLDEEMTIYRQAA
ncbi:MAG: HDOD domain-containing protein [Candidatus Eisenbacteria bacterium]|nr:HDOD domain-containing protein [Candidatus Eisenbacteria bacterium]